MGPDLQGREWVALAGRAVMALLAVAKTQKALVHTCSPNMSTQMFITTALLEYRIVGEMIRQ